MIWKRNRKDNCSLNESKPFAFLDILFGLIVLCYHILCFVWKRNIFPRGSRFKRLNMNNPRTRQTNSSSNCSLASQKNHSNFDGSLECKRFLQMESLFSTNLPSVPKHQALTQPIASGFSRSEDIFLKSPKESIALASSLISMIVAFYASIGFLILFGYLVFHLWHRWVLRFPINIRLRYAQPMGSSVWSLVMQAERWVCPPLFWIRESTPLYFKRRFAKGSLFSGSLLSFWHLSQNVSFSLWNSGNPHHALAF